MTPTTDDPTPPRKSPTMLILVILGIAGLGGALLCTCAIGAWLAILAARVTPELQDETIRRQAEQQWKDQEAQAQTDQYRAKAFLQYWLQLLAMKNLDEPYRLTSKPFQTRLSRQQFADFLDANPALQAEANFSFGIDARPGDRFAFQVHAGKRNFNAWVVKEGDEWRLDRVEP